MKSIARIVLFLFAVAAIVGMMVLWKKRDREAALAELKTRYNAYVSISEDEFQIGSDSPELINLVELGQLVARIGEPTLLDLTSAPNLESFVGVQQFQKLEALVAIDCPKLTSAEGVAGHPVLADLALTDSAAFADASAIRDLPMLETVDFSGCVALESVDLTTLSELKNLYFSRCRKLTSLDVSVVPKLLQLYLDGCGSLKTITGLSTLSQLTDLDVSNATAIQDLDGVGGLTQLIVLDIRNVDLESLDEIGTLPTLRILRLGGQSNLKSLAPFAGLSTLREIHLEACPEFSSLEGLPSSVSQYAGFTHCPKLTSLAGIEVATGLEQLDVKGCTVLADITSLSQLSNLVQLNLVQCRQVTEISALAGLEKLVIVMLGGSGVVPASVEDFESANKDIIFDFAVSE